MFRVFPIEGGKKYDKRYRGEAQADSRDIIRDDENIGVIAVKGAGTCILDFDFMSEDVRNFMNDIAEKGYLVVRTPSKGYHLYMKGIADVGAKAQLFFRSDNPEGKGHGGKKPAVDVQTYRNYCVGPTSALTGSGQGYENIGGYEILDAREASFNGLIMRICKKFGLWYRNSDTGLEINCGGDDDDGGSIIARTGRVEYVPLPEGSRNVGYMPQVMKKVGECKGDGMTDEETARVTERFFRKLIQDGPWPYGEGEFQEEVTDRMIPRCIERCREEGGRRRNGKDGNDDDHDDHDDDDDDDRAIPRDDGVGSGRYRRTNIVPEMWKITASRYFDGEGGTHREIPLPDRIEPPEVEEMVRDEGTGKWEWKPGTPTVDDYANAVMSVAPCLTIKGERKRHIYTLRNMVWEQADDYYMQKVQEMLGKGANPRLRDSIIGIMKGKRYCERDEFDAVPEVISLKNGFYDAKRRRMLTFAESVTHMSMTQFPRNYRADDEAGSGGSERYERALAVMFGGGGGNGNDAEKKKRQYLQFTGAGLTMRRYEGMRLCMMMHGTTNTGKSTITNITKRVIGDDKVSAVSMRMLNENSFAGAQMVRSHFNISSEQQKGMLANVQRFKEITSVDDAMFVEKKGQDGESVVPKCHMIFCSNEVMVPAEGDDDRAYYERILFFECDSEFERGDEIPNLGKDPDEADRVMMSFIRGLEEFIANGWRLSDPPDADDVRRRMLGRAHPMIQFIERQTLNKYEMTPQELELYKGVHRPTKDELRAVARAWMADEGFRNPPRDRDMDEYLETHGNFHIMKTRVKSDDGKGSENVTVWPNVCLKRWTGIGFSRIMELYPYLFHDKKNHVL